MVTPNDKDAVGFLLSGGNSHDGPKGRDLLRKIGQAVKSLPLIMDRAYEGRETRELAIELGYCPVVPPKKNRREPWEYDKEL